MRCPDCDVTWNEYGELASETCWVCGAVIEKPMPQRTWPQYVFPPAPRNYEGDRSE